MRSRVLVLPSVPTRDLLAMIEQLDDVIRELALIATGVMSGQAHATVPDEVLRTMDRARPLLFEAKEEVSRQATEAWSRGQDHVDLTLELPLDAVGAIDDVLAALETVDVQAGGDGAVLIPPADPVVARFRRWFFEELRSQLATG